MKLIKSVIFILLIVSLGLPSVKWKFISIAGREALNTSVYLLKDAQYVTAEITIKNDNRKPIQRFKYLRQAKNALEAKAEDMAYISVMLLPVHLTTTYSKIASFGNESVLKYRILVNLAHFKNDFLDASIALRKFFDSLPEIEDTDYKLSRAELAVENAEHNRSAILELIAKDLIKMKTLYGEDIQIELKGLQNPVKVIQLDDVKVAIFINYTIAIRLGGKDKN